MYAILHCTKLEIIKLEERKSIKCGRHILQIIANTGGYLKEI